MFPGCKTANKTLVMVPVFTLFVVAMAMADIIQIKKIY